jgi:hypothetical protein
MQSSSFYSDSEKRIFSFHNPEKNKRVYKDPYLLDIKIRKSFEKDDIEAIFGFIDQPGRLESVQKNIELYNMGILRLAPLLYEPFGLHELNEETGEGTTVDEAINIYIEFMNFLENIKKNTDVTPSGSPATDGHQEDLDEEIYPDSLTPNTLDSSSPST